MRAHLLLILILAILTCGCSARKNFWMPFAKSDCLECGSSDASQWTGLEDNFPHRTLSKQPRSGRFAFLNPFRRGAQGYHYESEVVDSSCTGCGAAGNFPGNGQCDGCLQNTVNHVLDSQPGMSRQEVLPQPLEPGIPAAPPVAPSSALPTSALPPKPEASSQPEISSRSKVVQPHPALSDHLPRANSTEAGSEFESVESNDTGVISVSPQMSTKEMAPAIPTTIVNDQRMNQIESSSSNSSVSTRPDGSKPARIFNQFNDDVDWANLPKPRSIAISTGERTGSEPGFQIKTHGNKGRVIEFVKPDQPQVQTEIRAQKVQEVEVISPPQKNPKVENFKLDDLFPGKKAEDEKPANAEPVAAAEQKDEKQTTKSVLEESEIEWGPPKNVNEKPKSTRRDSSDKSDSEYSVVPPNDKGDSDWGEDDESDWEEDDESDWAADEEDEAIYEDETGEFSKDADFTKPNSYDRSSKKPVRRRTEREIVEQLRTSTVPNQVVFDNSPQIPEQSGTAEDGIVLAARPVPHYQELRRLARTTMENAIEDERQVAIESLPAVRNSGRKLKAFQASTRRRDEPRQQEKGFDFQPLPNLLTPNPMRMEQLDVEYWQQEAFSPDSISQPMLPPRDNQTAVEQTDAHMRNVNMEPKQNSVPIILRAAPTFVGQDAGSFNGSNSSAKAKIRFIKPSFQREFDD